MLCCVETKVPEMKDINRYVTTAHADDWKDIGLELGLKKAALNIKGEDPQCFKGMIDKWQTLAGEEATWKALEVAITNIERQKLGLPPVKDVYGMKKYIIMCILYNKKIHSGISYPRTSIFQSHIKENDSNFKIKNGVSRREMKTKICNTRNKIKA